MTVTVPASSCSNIRFTGLMRTMLSAHWFPAIFWVEMSTSLMGSGMMMCVVTSSLTYSVLLPRPETI